MIKKIVIVVMLCLAGVIGLWYLPRKAADRIVRWVALIFLLGFAVRAGAYFF